MALFGMIRKKPVRTLRTKEFLMGDELLSNFYVHEFDYVNFKGIFFIPTYKFNN